MDGTQSPSCQIGEDRVKGEGRGKIGHTSDVTGEK